MIVPIGDNDICAWSDAREGARGNIHFITIFHSSDANFANHLVNSIIHVCKDGEVGLKHLTKLYFPSPPYIGTMNKSPVVFGKSTLLVSLVFF